MEPTRRWWAGAASAVVLVGVGVLLRRPLALLGAVGIGAWLLAHQYRFHRHLQGVRRDLAVVQAVARERVRTDEPVAVRLAAEVPGGTPLGLTVEAGVPIAARAADERTIALDPGMIEAGRTLRVSVPVAGRVAFDPPTVRVRDPAGLLGETLRLGPAPTLTVAPRAPRELHVGAGGDELTSPFGEHPTGETGSGLDPAELREYVPDDPADRIDWKATARLAEPYVREFEAETDRRTALLIDHRASLGTGRAGETALDYLRQVALALVSSARALDDPLGYYAVGDDGLTAVRPPAADRGHYNAIRTALHDLRASDTGSGRTRTRVASPAWARAAADRLDPGTPMGAHLRPFLASARPYVERIAERPLFNVARVHLPNLRGDVRTVICTDDTERAELREAVKAARRAGERVLVYLAPTVLYEPGGLADVEAAYGRYADFERFRRDLATTPGVDAYEVAPGDRLAAVLDAGRDRRRAARADGGGRRV